MVNRISRAPEAGTTENTLAAVGPPRHRCRDDGVVSHCYPPLFAFALLVSQRPLPPTPDGHVGTPPRRRL